MTPEESLIQEEKEYVPTNNPIDLQFKNSMSQNTTIGLIILLTLQLSMGIELELSGERNMETCTVILSSFDPVNVELKFPEIPGKTAGQSFGIRVTSFTDYAHQNYLEVSDNYTYRNTYNLETNIPYQLCVTFNTPKALNSFKPFYVSFTASEDFQSRIGGVEVPSQLASEENLKEIYHLASKLNQVSSAILGHQVKERKLEDDIVSRNLHKEKRIVLLGFVEVLIIVLCGVYQIFALRKFLIEKNLY